MLVRAVVWTTQTGDGQVYVNNFCCERGRGFDVPGETTLQDWFKAGWVLAEQQGLTTTTPNITPIILAKFVG